MVGVCYDVFLSHNSCDKPAVAQLKQLLCERGLDSWLDRDELRPGLNWQRELAKAIQQSRSVAVLIGADGIGPWEDEEMQAALNLAVQRQKQQPDDPFPVIPVLLPGCPDKPDIDLFLANRTWVDLRDGFTDEPLDRLVYGITGKKPVRRQVPNQGTVPLSSPSMAELTAHARGQIASAARQWLDTECDPFIVPSLSRPKRNPEPRALTDPKRAWEPLRAEELQALFQGRLPEQANRVRIVGDSGMGKTALLHCVEAETASAEHGWLPIRIEGLAAYDWQQDRDKLLQTIAERLLHKHLPDGVTAKDRLDWLRELAEQGRVVFLLDALDQTDKQRVLSASVKNLAITTRDVYSNTMEGVF